MLKIFTTQLISLFNQIQKDEEALLEDTARFLSQAMIGEGAVYIQGLNEMKAVENEACHGKERLPKIKPLKPGHIDALHPADRVLLLSRDCDDALLSVAEALHKRAIPFVLISATEEKDNQAAELADIYMTLHVKRSLVPSDSGERVGYPASLVALYTYFCLHLLITEILFEYEN